MHSKCTLFNLSNRLIILLLPSFTTLSCVSQNRAGRVTPLVIGTGAYGRLPVMKEVKLEAERRHVDWSSYRPVRPSGS